MNKPSLFYILIHENISLFSLIPSVECQSFRYVGPTFFWCVGLLQIIPNPVLNNTAVQTSYPHVCNARYWCYAMYFCNHCLGGGEPLLNSLSHLAPLMAGLNYVQWQTEKLLLGIEWRYYNHRIEFMKVTCIISEVHQELEYTSIDSDGATFVCCPEA